MFVSEKDKFIFIHTPKTAGSSIHIFFKDYYCLKGKDRQDPIPPIHHMKAKLFLKYNNLNSFYKFAFVRNPFDRLVSAFSDFTQIRPKYVSRRKKIISLLGFNKYKYEYDYYELEDKNHESYSDLCEKGLKFNNKKESLKIKKNETFRDFCMKFAESKWLNDIHFAPQTEFLCDSKNKLLLDFVGKYENLEEDLKIISENIGIKIQISHHRKTNHLNYRKYYDAETQEIIRNIYKDDLNLFGYSF